MSKTKPMPFLINPIIFKHIYLNKLINNSRNKRSKKMSEKTNPLIIMTMNQKIYHHSNFLDILLKYLNYYKLILIPVLLILNFS